MAGVELGFLAPHPWIMVAGEREGGHHAQTTSAFRQAQEEIVRRGVDLLVVASPHWAPGAQFRIGGAPRYAGTLAEFLPHIHAALPPEHRRDLPPVPYNFPGEAALAARLLEAGKTAGLSVQIEAKPEALDHGSMVPILYLNPEGRLPVLLLSAEEGPAAQSRRWGEIIGEELRRTGRRAAFIASGTLSHHFVFDRPDALWPPGEAWDRRFLSRLTAGETEAVFGYTDKDVAEGELEAGGLHALYMLLGALGPGPAADLLSYEGIVGVGSPVVQFEPAA
ncbi:MAG: hypothetical protein O2807_04215 [bacterium]|nr:hypothetical protein [bacterium]